ncbi:MAG: S41 family peptidase [Armatimonadota bacterium]
MQVSKTHLSVRIILIAALFGLGIYMRNVYDNSPVAARIAIVRNTQSQMKLASTEMPSTYKVSDNIDNMQLYNDVYRLVKGQYVDEVKNDQEMAEESIRGMIGSLNDPMSQYLSVDETAEYRDHLIGTYHGIGAETTVKTYKIGKTGYAEIQVVTPIEGGAAFKAGIRAKDVIVEVDGKWIISHNPMDAVPSGGALKTRLEAFDKAKKKLEDGVPVSNVLKLLSSKDCPYKTITIRRGSKQMNMKMICETVTTPSATLITSAQDTMVVKLHILRLDTASALTDMLHQAHFKRLIIDMRNTAGFDILSAQRVYSLIAGRGLMGYSKMANKPLTMINSSDGRGIDQKITLLIGNGTSGTAELLAAALKQAKKATLIGEPTFGQPLVSDLYPFDDGSAIKLVTKKLLTPTKLDFAGKGISPDRLLAGEQNQGDIPVKLAMQPAVKSVTK